MNNKPIAILNSYKRTKLLEGKPSNAHRNESTIEEINSTTDHVYTLTVKMVQYCRNTKYECIKAITINL